MFEIPHTFLFKFCQFFVKIFSNSCPDFFFRFLQNLRRAQPQSLWSSLLWHRRLCRTWKNFKKIHFRTWLELRTIQDQIYTRIPWKFIWKYLRRGGLCFDSKLCDVNNENIATWPQRPISYNKLHKYLAVNSFDLSIQINLIWCLISRVQICSFVVMQI